MVKNKRKKLIDVLGRDDVYIDFLENKEYFLRSEFLKIKETTNEYIFYEIVAKLLEVNLLKISFYDKETKKVFENYEDLKGISDDNVVVFFKFI